MFKEGVKYTHYKPGDKLDLTVSTFDNHQRLVSHQEQITVEKRVGNGFFGGVLLLEGRPEVLKTTQPDPLHDLLRWAAWGSRAFPSQVSDHAIQLDHLAVNLISDVLPVATDGKFTAPASRGITELPSGYALLIDKVKGRGPRFYPVNEFPKFRQAQRELAQIAYDLGLEQVGQIHPDNPFGMANEWTTDNAEHFVWLDSLAAFKYEPIFGVLRYKFHEEINRHFYPKGDQTAYNQIHADTFVSFISKIENKFDPATYRKIRDRVELYEMLLEQSYGEVTPFILKPAIAETLEVSKEIPLKAGKVVLKTLELLGAAVSSKIRRNMVFAGIEKGVETGLVTEDELKQAVEVYKQYETQKDGSLRLKAAEAASGLSYAAIFFGTKGLEASIQLSNAFSDQDTVLKTLTALGISAGFQIGSMASRLTLTALIGLAARTDLRAAAVVSTLPFAGNFLPFSIQAVVNSGSRDKSIWHYSVRDYVAKLSSIIYPMAGGWGTQREGELYTGRIGGFLENLAVKQTTDELVEEKEPEIEIAYR